MASLDPETLGDMLLQPGYCLPMLGTNCSALQPNLGGSSTLISLTHLTIRFLSILPLWDSLIR